MGDYSENLNISTFCEDQNLDVIDGLKISIQEVGLEEKWIENFNWRHRVGTKTNWKKQLSIKDDIFEEVLERAQEE